MYSGFFLWYNMRRAYYTVMSKLLVRNKSGQPKPMDNYIMKSVAFMI